MGPPKAALARAHPDCIFEGVFFREEIGRHYAFADNYIHASLTETFGNVLTEALASGLAVADFDYAAARQFVPHGENGLAVPSDHPEALINAAVWLATDELLSAQVRRAARAAVEPQSRDNVIARFGADLLAVANAQPGTLVSAIA